MKSESVRKFGIVPAGIRCPETGKRGWVSRADAKKVARNVHPGEHMSAYKCRCGYWHLGHLPGQVRKGIATRDALRRKDDA